MHDFFGPADATAKGVCMPQKLQYSKRKTLSTILVQIVDAKMYSHNLVTSSATSGARTRGDVFDLADVEEINTQIESTDFTWCQHVSRISSLLQTSFLSPEKICSSDSSIKMPKIGQRDEDPSQSPSLVHVIQI